VYEASSWQNNKRGKISGYCPLNFSRKTKFKVTFFGRRLPDRPEDREGSVQRGVPRQGPPQRHGRRPQEGPDIRDDGQQGQARLHEGDTAVAGRATVR